MKNIINIEIIKKFISDNELTKTAFCKTCGISLNTLNKIFINDTDIANYALSALFKIAKTLKRSISDLFNF